MGKKNTLKTLPFVELSAELETGIAFEGEKCGMGEIEV